MGLASTCSLSSPAPSSCGDGAHEGHEEGRQEARRGGRQEAEGHEGQEGHEGHEEEVGPHDERLSLSLAAHICTVASTLICAQRSTAGADEAGYPSQPSQYLVYVSVSRSPSA